MRRSRGWGTLEMKAWILGSGVPTPSRTRVSSGYLIEADGEYLVFDHGFGAFQRLLELGIDLGKISHLFFTHLHYDHMGDFARLVLTRWDQGGGLVKDLKVYGPPPLARIAERLFAEDGAFGPDITARTRDPASLDLYRLRGGVGERARPAPAIREIGANETIESGSWRVQTTEVRHFTPLLTCYAYRITHGGRSIVYSGDTGPNDTLVALAKDCDVLIHMCHYISGTAASAGFAASATGHKELAQIARDCGAKSLVLTHITQQIDQPGVRERVIAEIAEIYRGTIILGSDLLGIPLDGPGHARLD
jgi:ribonuclease Z